MSLPPCSFFSTARADSASAAVNTVLPDRSNSRFLRAGAAASAACAGVSASIRSAVARLPASFAFTLSARSRRARSSTATLSSGCSSAPKRLMQPVRVPIQDS